MLFLRNLSLFTFYVSRTTRTAILSILLDKPPSQQFHSRLDDFHCGDAPNQVQRLVTHLVDVSSFVGHAGKPQYGLLPQILSVDLGYGEIEFLPQSIFETQQHLPLVLQRLTLGDEQLDRTESNDDTHRADSRLRALRQSCRSHRLR